MVSQYMLEDEYVINVKVRRPITSDTPPLFNLSCHQSRDSNGKLLNCNLHSDANRPSSSHRDNPSSTNKDIIKALTFTSDENDQNHLQHSAVSLPNQQPCEETDSLDCSSHSDDRSQTFYDKDNKLLLNVQFKSFNQKPHHESSDEACSSGGKTMVLPQVKIFNEEEKLLTNKTFKSPKTKTEAKCSKQGSLYVERIPDHCKSVDGQLYVPPVLQNKLKTQLEDSLPMRGNSKRSESDRRNAKLRKDPQFLALRENQLHEEAKMHIQRFLQDHLNDRSKNSLKFSPDASNDGTITSAYKPQIALVFSLPSPACPSSTGQDLFSSQYLPSGAQLLPNNTPHCDSNVRARISTKCARNNTLPCSPCFSTVFHGVQDSKKTSNMSTGFSCNEINSINDETLPSSNLSSGYKTIANKNGAYEKFIGDKNSCQSASSKNYLNNIVSDTNDQKTDFTLAKRLNSQRNVQTYVYTESRHSRRDAFSDGENDRRESIQEINGVCSTPESLYLTEYTGPLSLHKKSLHKYMRDFNSVPKNDLNHSSENKPKNSTVPKTYNICDENATDQMDACLNCGRNEYQPSSSPELSYEKDSSEACSLHYKYKDATKTADDLSEYCYPDYTSKKRSKCVPTASDGPLKLGNDGNSHICSYYDGNWAFASSTDDDQEDLAFCEDTELSENDEGIKQSVETDDKEAESPILQLLSRGCKLTTYDIMEVFPFINEGTMFEVKVEKTSRGLGLSLTGGCETRGPYSGLVRIKKLHPQMPAWLCGELKQGDIILEVNGVTLTGLTSYEALEIIRTSKTGSVHLLVCRVPPHVLADDGGPSSNNQLSSSSIVESSLFASLPSRQMMLSPTPSGEFEVSLTKVKGSLGFTLRKQDNSVMGHTVRSLVREPALSDGRIKPGDKILSVNGVDLCGLTHEEAVACLRTTPETVKIRLYRDAFLTPVSPMSPSEPEVIVPKCLRQEARDMLTDIAFRKNSSKLSTSNRDQTQSNLRRRRLQHQKSSPSSPSIVEMTERECLD